MFGTRFKELDESTTNLGKEIIAYIDKLYLKHGICIGSITIHQSALEERIIALEKEIEELKKARD